MHQHDGRTLIAAARSKVAQGAEQIRKPPGRRPLGRHVADQIAFLVPDRVVDGIAQSSAREARKVVVGEILDLHFIGPAFQSGRIRR